ncbi:3-hydroxyacyl-CoA dehydrogenase [Chelatococcus asaccharovorans]|uniref:3-hydroxyacyl-CoA dehydrogenase n=1 Tax=Chelatococcus asaccharovorans TaxID=28210 RepID=UPI00224C6F42|nr:3-hydroxyacyl-CoA dehydrogenase [Chelatococcus asaccharovorans]CAH1685529.1 3-hydroxyacyl-CoA dehydrogenase [Chelatococcus asaccharovorans]
MGSVGIIGTGFIGRAWSVCFARAGHRVSLWDPVPGSAQAARDFIAHMLPDLDRFGLLNGSAPEDVLGRIHLSSSMAEAVSEVEHVQENAPERLDLKIDLFAQLDALAPKTAVIASSTSALLPSAFTADLAGRNRCIVAHPVNPPHLIPLVEIVPAPWTDGDTIARTEALMREIGQTPVHVRREIDGFVLNRLQAAVLDEAFRLVADGYASAADVDACMRDGLALRWSFMGPFETIDLNAPDGIRDYVARYQAMYRGMTETMRDSADWSGPVLDTIEAERRRQLPQEDLKKRQIWRDRQLMALAAHRRRASGL